MSINLAVSKAVKNAVKKPVRRILAAIPVPLPNPNILTNQNLSPDPLIIPGGAPNGGFTVYSASDPNLDLALRARNSDGIVPVSGTTYTFNAGDAFFVDFGLNSPVDLDYTITGSVPPVFSPYILSASFVPSGSALSSPVYFSLDVLSGDASLQFIDNEDSFPGGPIRSQGLLAIQLLGANTVHGVTNMANGNAVAPGFVYDPFALGTYTFTLTDTNNPTSQVEITVVVV